MVAQANPGNKQHPISGTLCRGLMANLDDFFKLILTIRPVGRRSGFISTDQRVMEIVTFSLDLMTRLRNRGAPKFPFF
jgi:hypothetical protein